MAHPVFISGLIYSPFAFLTHIYIPPPLHEGRSSSSVVKLSMEVECGEYWVIPEPRSRFKVFVGTQPEVDNDKLSADSLGQPSSIVYRTLPRRLKSDQVLINNTESLQIYPQKVSPSNTPSQLMTTTHTVELIPCSLPN